MFPEVASPLISSPELHTAAMELAKLLSLALLYLAHLPPEAKIIVYGALAAALGIGVGVPIYFILGLRNSSPPPQSRGRVIDAKFHDIPNRPKDPPHH